MPYLDGLAVATITCGLVLAIIFPFLARAHVYLLRQRPRTPFGRGATFVADEAGACLLTLTGIIRLLGHLSLSEPISEIRVFVGAVFIMAVLGAAFAEITNPDASNPGDT